MEKKTIGGSKQTQRVIEQREQTGNCKYCGKIFERIMFPGPNPVVCENCVGRYEEIQRELARERMRRLRAERKAMKKAGQS